MPKRHPRLPASLFMLFFVLSSAAPVFAQKSFSAAEAKDHIGQNATVCGEVVSTHYARSSRGSPTFLNFDQAYPNQIFTVVIWGSDRPKFGDPETAYRGKHACVTGKITSFRGVPEVAAYQPSQINVQ